MMEGKLCGYEAWRGTSMHKCAGTEEVCIECAAFASAVA